MSSGVQNQGTVLNAVTPTLTSPFVTIGAEAATQALNTAAVAQESLTAVPGETTPATEPSAATMTATLPVTPCTGAPAQPTAESTTAQTATVTTTVDSEVDAATTPGSGAATAEDRPPSATAAIRLEQLGMTKLRQYAETARSDAAKPQSSTPQSEAVAATDTDPAPQIGAAISAARTATGAEAPVPPATLKPTNESMTNEAPNVSEMAEEDGEPVQVAATVSNTEPRQKLTEHLEHKDVHVKATPEATIDGGEHTASTPHASTEANVARMTTTMATHVTADPTQVRSQVVRHLATGLTPGSGSEKVNIQLNPEALGQVDVEFTAHGDRLSVVITASSGEAEQALREGVRELTDAIMDKAARFQSVDVKVDVRDGQEQKQESRSDQRQDGRRDRSGRDGQSPRDQQKPHDGSAAAKGWAEANEED